MKSRALILSAAAGGSLMLGWAFLTVIQAQPPPPAKETPEAMLQCDWIVLPHAEANRLLRQPGRKEASGEAIHAEAMQLVRAGKGHVLHQQTFNVKSGEQASLNEVREFDYPTEFTLPWMSSKVVVQGGNVIEGDLRPMAPASMETKELGFSLGVETTIADGNWYVDLNVTARWTTHVDDMKWGAGASEAVMPVFHACNTATQVLCVHGQWKVVSLMRPAVEGPGAAAQSFSTDRVILLIKPTVRHPGDPDPDKISHVKEAGVLFEWIGMDAVTADQWMDDLPPSGRTDALRAAVQELLDQGKAELVETAYNVVRGGQNSVCQSLLEFPYPTEFEPPDLPASITELPSPVPPLPITRPVFWPVPACGQSFEFKGLGTVTRNEATVSDDGTSIHVTSNPELTLLAGLQQWGQGPSLVKQPRFASMTSASDFLLRRGQPALWGCYDAMPTPSLEVVGNVAPRGNPDRRILLFVTAQ